ncbi:hypothetical protein ACFL0R_03630 [Pseudomonadota bacterium]
MIELCKSEEFTLTLDPVEVEKRASSVSFHVVAEMSLSYQRTKLEMLSCWIKMEALSRFEGELDELQQKKSGSVVLLNHKQQPVITIDRADDEIQIIVEAGDTMGYGKTRLEVPGYTSELAEMVTVLRDYEKTW